MCIRDRSKAAQIAECGKLMSRMINDILDLSRARLGGGIPISPHALDAGELVALTVQGKSTVFPNAQIQADCQGDLAARWDSDRIGQLLTNLVTNAVRHGQEGFPVEIKADGSQAAEIVLTVRNKGAIPADILPHVFEPFRRAKNPSNSDGLGLGLYIVWEIAQAHGGSVTAEATPDDHTVMRVRLPRGQ